MTNIDPTTTWPAYAISSVTNDSLQTRFVLKDKQLTKEMNKYKWTHGRKRHGN